MYGPAVRYKMDFQDRRTWELHQCIRSRSGADFCSGPSWVSARIQT